MKRWVKQNTDISEFTKDGEPSGGSTPDVSIDRLLDQGLLALSREIRNLTTASIQGKLSSNDARDLRDHLKLLFELKERENELLKGKTDEELIKELDDVQTETE